MRYAEDTIYLYPTLSDDSPLRETATDDFIPLCLDILDTIFQGIFEGNSKFESAAVLRGQRLAYGKTKKS